MKTSCFSRITLLALMSLFALIPALAGDWPHWRGPNRDGISTEPGFSTDWPKEGPKQLWKAELGAGFSSVCISNGRLFTLGNMINHFNSCVLIEGHLYGVNCDTKRIAEGNLRCIDFKTGQVKWTHEGTGAGTQMAVGNKLVVLTGAGELIVAEATPSEFRPLARAQVLGGRCWTVPVFANGRLYCRNLQGTLVCLDVKSRTTARRYE